MLTFAFMHHPYLVCILFGTPSLHLFTFLVFFNFFFNIIDDGAKPKGDSKSMPRRCLISECGKCINMQVCGKIVTYSSVFKLWFTCRASANTVAPSDPISLLLRLYRREDSKIHALLTVII